MACLRRGGCLDELTCENLQNAETRIQLPPYPGGFVLGLPVSRIEVMQLKELCGYTSDVGQHFVK